MPTTQDAQTLASTAIPALGAKWKAWAEQQVAAAQAAAAAQIAALTAQVADLTAQLSKANEGLTQTVGDHSDDIATLQSALAAAEPPAN